jgi:hypothetical protein
MDANIYCDASCTALCCRRTEVTVMQSSDGEHVLHHVAPRSFASSRSIANHRADAGSNKRLAIQSILNVFLSQNVDRSYEAPPPPPPFSLSHLSAPSPSLRYHRHNHHLFLLFFFLLFFLLPAPQPPSLCCGLQPNQPPIIVINLNRKQFNIVTDSHSEKN